MKTRIRVVILLITGISLASLLTGCSREDARDIPKHADKAADQIEDTLKSAIDEEPLASATTRKNLPKMIDLGRGKCIPCKMMEPILKRLKEEYQGRAIIEVIDLAKKPEAAKEYAIRLIPTQIFFDSDGSEVWRHEGFLPRDVIVQKFRDLGVEPPDE